MTVLLVSNALTIAIAFTILFVRPALRPRREQLADAVRRAEEAEEARRAAEETLEGALEELRETRRRVGLLLGERLGPKAAVAALRELGWIESVDDGDDGVRIRLR